MDDIVVSTFVVCHAEKRIENLYKKSKRLSKRYDNNKVNIIEKRREKYVCFEEFDNRIKSLERKLSVKNKLS